MDKNQTALAKELAKRDPPAVQAVGAGLRDEALEQYYIAVLRRNGKWSDFPNENGDAVV